MENAFPLPVDQVAPLFEPARVQMDFAPERVVPSKPFLTVSESDEDAACSWYASAARGEFKNEGKPGWFFLAAAERASSESATAAGPAPIVYEGQATVHVDTSDGVWEKLVVDQIINEDVSIVTMHDTAGGSQGFMPVAKKEVIRGQTHLHLQGIDYQSDFDVPRRENTGLVGGAGKGGAYSQTDIYLPRHRARFPSGAWEAGGMGFGQKVFIQAKPPGAVETAGLSPDVRLAGKKYFAGRLLVFTHVHARTSLDARTLGIILHEFTHAFGYPHKCGYYGWPQPAEFSCAMNYFLTWLYVIGTRTLDRFVFGTTSAHLCSKHLAGVREVNLEDNPVMWTWT